MGENTNIEWAHHTFSPWTGCSKVSAACRNCYAETRSVRFGHSKVGKHLPLWGPESRRQMRVESYWRNPLKWDRAAKASGERHRVFCMSLGDLFEELPAAHPDACQLYAARARLVAVILATPHLDWLLLTKRPENIQRMLRTAIQDRNNDENDEANTHWVDPDQLLPNVWLGVTAESQVEADKRIPQLLATPASLHFLSCEPLLGQLDLSRYLRRGGACVCDPAASSQNRCNDLVIRCDAGLRSVGWVIAGGESGKGARISEASWFRRLRDDCAQAGVPYLFKQWGACVDVQNIPPAVAAHADTLGQESNDWGKSGKDFASSVRLGKKHSGRMLDGRTHDGLPFDTDTTWRGPS